MSPSHGLPAGSVTRQRRRFRSCSIDIPACRLAGTGQLDALTAVKGKETFRKQKSPADLGPAEVRAVLSFMSDSDVHLFGYCECVIDLYSRVANGAFDLRVPQEKLNGSQVACTSVNQDSLCSTSGMYSAGHFVSGRAAAKSAANSNPSLLCMGLFSIFCMRACSEGHPHRVGTPSCKSPLPATGEGW